VALIDKLRRLKRTSIEKRRLRLEKRTYEKYKLMYFDSVAELSNAHFSTWSDISHLNRPGFDAALALMAGKQKIILETGTSAWGTDSTRLWDAYISRFGGEFWSVDLSSDPSKRLQHQVSPNTHLEVSDSVTFINGFSELSSYSIVDVCYLDSWDLDWNDPHPAEQHGLNEWHAVAQLMGPGSVLIIDDSPVSIDWVPEPYQELAREYESAHGHLPGKGSLIDIELRDDPRVEIIWQGYNSVYLFKESVR
jgi:hypothetical protein